jgi:hypothetical protein
VAPAAGERWVDKLGAAGANRSGRHNSLKGMNTVKRILVTLSTLLVALSMPLAAETVKGYLVDKMCSAKVAKEGAEAAKAHTKDCALMPNCQSSGYGVFTADGKFLKFDEDGDRFAVKMLGFSSSKDNIKVTVDGEVKGDSIAVKALQLN